ALAFGTLLIPQTGAFAGDCNSCAVEQPDTVVLPPTPEDGCSSCVLPTPAPQRLADPCSSCAIQQDYEPIITQEPQDCSNCALPKLRQQRASVPAKRSSWRNAAAASGSRRPRRSFPLLGQMLNQLRRGAAQRRIAIPQRNQLIVAQLVELFGQVEVQRDRLRGPTKPPVQYLRRGRQAQRGALRTVIFPH